MSGKKLRLYPRFGYRGGSEFSGGGGNTLPLSNTSYFSADGGPKCWYGGSTNYNAFYSNGKTYVFYQHHVGYVNQRINKVKAFNHNTGLWGRAQGTGREGIAGDSHGVPAACALADGRLFTVYGNHNGNLKVSVSENPDDETEWVQATDLVGAYTYPHPVLRADNSVTLLLRKRYTAGQNGWAVGTMTLVYRPYTFAGAVATAGAEVEIGNFADNARWYQGPAFLHSDGLIWQVASRADLGDSFRRDVYLYGIDTANGRLQNWSGTTSNFPVAGATMNSTFRIYTTPGDDDMEIPSFEKDTNGVFHIVFAEKEMVDTDKVFYHMYSNGPGSAWSSPVAIGTTASGPRLIREAGGIMSIYYCQSNSIYRRQWDGVSWSDAELVMEQDVSRWPLRGAATVFNAHANARVIWAEDANVEDNTQVDPLKRMYLFGDAGIVANAKSSAPSPATLTGQGFILDAGNLASLFQDTAATTPVTTAGQDVGQWNDLSANANHFDAVGTEEPVYRTDGETAWIEAGDQPSPTSNMLSVSFNPQSGNALWACIAGRTWVTDGNTAEFLSVDTGGVANNRYMRLSRFSTNGGEATMIGYNAGNTAFTLQKAGFINGLATDIVMGGYINGTDIRYYEDGVEVDSDTLTGGVLDNVAIQTRIFAGMTGGGAVSFQGQGMRIYRAILRAGPVDLATREADMAWCAAGVPR